MQNLFGEVIYSYSREQAIDDGVLVDVSEIASEAGFKIPVAITQAVYSVINDIPKSKSYQDFDGRLWDVVYMGSMAARRHRDRGTILYPLTLHHMERKNVYFKPKCDFDKGTYKDGYWKEKNVLQNNITLKMVVTGGDQGEPVITIMLPDED